MNLNLQNQIGYGSHESGNGEIELSDCKSFESPHPSKGEIRGKWSRGAKGWWRCDLEGKESSPSALELKFSPGRTVVYGLSHLNGSGSLMANLDLLDVLKDTTACRVPPSICHDSLEKLAMVLELADDPVPVLEYLQMSRQIRCRIQIRTILFAMQSGKFTRLKSLVWDALGLDDADIQLLAVVLREGLCPSLSVLFLRKNFFRSDGASFLASYLGCLQNLQHLDFSGNDMGAGHAALAQAMESRHLLALESLSLDFTGIRDADCESYEKGLRSGNVQELKILSLRGNRIGIRGSKALARAYESGEVNCLISIHLSKNVIGDEGIKALTPSLCRLPDLRELHLDNNIFTEEGVDNISRRLLSGNLKSLEFLDLRSSLNPTEKGARALLFALAKCEAVTIVRFEWSKFPALDQRLLQRVHVNDAEVVAGLDFRRLPDSLLHNSKMGRKTLKTSMRRTWWQSFRSETKVSANNNEINQYFEIGEENWIEEGLRQAVELGAFPPDVLNGIEMADTAKINSANSAGDAAATRELVLSDCEASSSTSKDDDGETSMNQWSPMDEVVLSGLQGFHTKLDYLREVMEMSLNESREVKIGVQEILKTQKTQLQKFQEVRKIFLGDRESSCPRFMYLAKKRTGAWITLKDAISTFSTVHVHFACEARFNDYALHHVSGQRGLKVSKLKNWVQKVAPFLQMSMLILFLTAKITANFVAPGLGTIFPNFVQWQQAASLADGLALATGFSKHELDTHMYKRIQPSSTSSQSNPQELYGYSRKAVTELLRSLTPHKFQQKVGLQKVSLDREDGSFHGCVWICKECYEKYRESNASMTLLTDL